LLHRFSLLDYFSEEIDAASLELAAKAKSILLQNFISPPTIESLAHLCATNESKIKKVFKKVHQTTLHSYVQKLIDEGVISEDMRYSHPQKNIILQSLGGEKDIRIDVYKNSLEPGEKLLLTTDGIHDYIDDKQIKNILLDSHNIEKNVSSLISDAKNANSKDDLTALVVKCT